MPNLNLIPISNGPAVPQHTGPISHDALHTVDVHFLPDPSIPGLSKNYEAWVTVYRVVGDAVVPRHMWVRGYRNGPDYIAAILDIARRAISDYTPSQKAKALLRIFTLPSPGQGYADQLTEKAREFGYAVAVEPGRWSPPRSLDHGLGTTRPGGEQTPSDEDAQKPIPDTKPTHPAHGAGLRPGDPGPGEGGTCPPTWYWWLAIGAAFFLGRGSAQSEQ